MTIGPAPTFCEKCGKPFDEHDTLSICPGSRLVPRVAESSDDLRVGMVVVAKHRINQDWDYPFEIDSPLPDTAFVPWDAYTVVILSDPPPEPVRVPADLIDALADVVSLFDSQGSYAGDRWGRCVAAAKAVVAAARNGTDQ